jgi:hypothetical protein
MLNTHTGNTIPGGRNIRTGGSGIGLIPGPIIIEGIDYLKGSCWLNKIESDNNISCKQKKEIQTLC